LNYIGRLTYHGGVAISRRGPLLLLFTLDNRTTTLMTNYFTGAPLTPADYGVMSALRLIQPTRPSELAGMLGMRPTTLSNYLARLRTRGLIARGPDPTDGRAALLNLTTTGRQLTLQCDPHFRAARDAFVSELQKHGVDPEDVLDMLETVDRTLDEATEAIPAHPPAGR